MFYKYLKTVAPLKKMNKKPVTSAEPHSEPKYYVSVCTYPGFKNYFKNSNCYRVKSTKITETNKQTDLSLLITAAPNLEIDEFKSCKNRPSKSEYWSTICENNKCFKVEEGKYGDFLKSLGCFESNRLGDRCPKVGGLNLVYIFVDPFRLNMGTSDNGYHEIKVGMSDAGDRETDLKKSVCAGYMVGKYKCEKSCKAVETMIHSYLIAKGRHVGGEWFRIYDIENLKETVECCATGGVPDGMFPSEKYVKWTSVFIIKKNNGYELTDKFWEGKVEHGQQCESSDLLIKKCRNFGINEETREKTISNIIDPSKTTDGPTTGSFQIAYGVEATNDSNSGIGDIAVGVSKVTLESSK